MKIARLLLLLVTCLTAHANVQSAERSDIFKIRVEDDETGRGVPLVELKTVTNQRYVTDSAGLIAIREPELFGQTAFL